MTSPGVSPAFEWLETTHGRVLAARPLRVISEHAFTTRGFGVVTAPDTAVDALSGLASFFGVDRSAIVRVRQVHGCAVTDVRRGEDVGVSAADALVSQDTERPVAVVVADCVPILLADRRGRAVAAVHAGWRGTAARIVGETVQSLGRAGIRADELVAAIGPSIGPCCYQVDAPVRDAMLSASPAAAEWFTPDGHQHWRLDLWRANAEQLAEAGVPAGAIHVARYCTADHLDDCFSYRKEGARAGRLFGAIRLLPQP